MAIFASGMQRSFNRMRETQRKLAASGRALDSIANSRTALAQAAVDAAAQRIIPEVRQELFASFVASGIKSKSFTLVNAHVWNAKIRRGRHGIVIETDPASKNYQSKSGEKPGDVYAAGGAHKYGSVRQPLTKAVGSLYRDLPTGQMRPRKFAAGEFGERAKRTLKKKFKSGRVGDLSFVPAKRPFFDFNAAQRKRLIELEHRYVNEELAKRGLTVFKHA